MKFIPLYFFIAVLTAALLFISPSDSVAQSDEAKVHTVEARETLFSIARQYGISVQDIREWNRLDSDVLSPGTKLYVSEPPVRRQETPPAPDTPSAPPAPGSHVVQAGETLFNISRRYNVSINDLRSWNNLDSHVLSIGQVLVVREGTQAADRPAPDPDPELSKPEDSDADPLRVTREAASYQYYTVRAGDTLSSIARRYSTTVSDLREWNNLRGDVISINQELIVGKTASAPGLTGLGVESTAQGRFYSREVERTDNIFRILQNHQMDETDFRALNGGLSPDDVRTGMTVVLLAPPTVRHTNPYLKSPQSSQVSNENGDAVPVILYSDSERGQTTTGGDLYNPDHLTAAHSSVPLGTVVHVQNPDNGRGVFVLVNDRVTGNRIKLSRKAFQTLGLQQNEPRVVVNQNIN